MGSDRLEGPRGGVRAASQLVRIKERRAAAIRAPATVSVSVVIGSPQQRPRAEAEHRCAAEPADRPELRAQWRALPKSIRPEEWVTETGVKQVPDSLLIAESQRRPEGYYPCGS